MDKFESWLFGFVCGALIILAVVWKTPYINLAVLEKCDLIEKIKKESGKREYHSCYDKTADIVYDLKPRLK